MIRFSLLVVIKTGVEVFSCNGFDAYVPKEVASDLTYANVWNHLLSVHEETPIHLLLWGEDQNYIDFILEDIPFLCDVIHRDVFYKT